MTSFRLPGLQTDGFCHPVPFKPIERLDVLDYRAAPDVEGVYAILHRPSQRPDFLPPDHPRRTKAALESCLAKRWIPQASILYIGKAPFRSEDDRGKRDALWQRIKEYRGTIYRSRTDHLGGEDLRRLPDRDSFLLTWKAVAEPSQVERGLIIEFTGVYKKRPFGNRDDGDGPLISSKCCTPFCPTMDVKIGR